MRYSIFKPRDLHGVTFRSRTNTKVCQCVENILSPLHLTYSMTWFSCTNLINISLPYLIWFLSGEMRIQKYAGRCNM